jgi:hypothetical protein
MQKVHLIEVKYMPPTENKGSRVIAKSLRFGDSIIFSYDYKYNNINEMFEAWLKELNNDLGIVSIGYDEKNSRYIYGVSVFEPMHNIKKGGVLV